ncbi:hypothetical protein LMH87_005924 [Akanthomyces muscarius]|uniref:Uncharacterized protein n=1 Tax=Akanthomyces muscarius TaxID=2231603 RepID=A0A9W8QPB2_AKAMU|nr:hypothetical protein LMH87_005924 [Akanthomyces muscarius]KAJ4164241.1 hypothetical protein LMH87_005924 [Akanthomyces muscarius]
MASSANASVVAQCGCSPECSQPCSSVETQNRLRAERLDLMLAAADTSIVALQAKQSHIPTCNLPEQKSDGAGKDSTKKANGSAANGNN